MLASSFILKLINIVMFYFIILIQITFKCTEYYRVKTLDCILICLINNENIVYTTGIFR